MYADSHSDGICKKYSDGIIKVQRLILMFGVVGIGVSSISFCKLSFLIKFDEWESIAFQTDYGK